MNGYRSALPQLGRRLFVTDGGLETTLIYLQGLELPSFAAFVLLDEAQGRDTLRRYFEDYAAMARAYDLGLVLESPTWRASRDWGARLGYDDARLAQLNRRSIEMLAEIRATYESPTTPVVVSGNIGPRGDGYVPDRRMSAQEAYDYHARQVETFAATAADMVAAFTLNYSEEALGVVRAARAHAMPVAIAFTVETDGRLPSGETLEEAITATDAATDAYTAYYLVNCAHPTHFAHLFADASEYLRRIRGLRANASTRSHAELDASTELDAGDPHTLAMQYRALREVLPQLTVVGGCCGTDQRHVEEICRALTGSQSGATRAGTA